MIGVVLPRELTDVDSRGGSMCFIITRVGEIQGMLTLKELVCCVARSSCYYLLILLYGLDETG
jgi:hypothetical protein